MPSLLLPTPTPTLNPLTGDVIASDHVGAGPGDKVLLVTGSVAGRYSMESPTDAAIVAILDPEKA